ncbi:uncharacterized protein BDV17DRAFT_283429 [Aspergillus undulatus]|uniref:uncharacterized protein n=1 Tax=Aspergillus undulatus TaxID=1810928 RepID=UPI003CCCB09C
MTDLDSIGPAEIIFRKRLFTSEVSNIFLVTVRSQTCIMKVHHGRGTREDHDPNRELDIHILETTAYRRMLSKGLCDQGNGIVPRFLGYTPSALFLEYIPNMEMIDIHNFTSQRADRLVLYIRKIHEALVLHNDPQPRNMMLVTEPEPKSELTDRDRARIYLEERIVIEFKEAMVNCKLGNLDQAYLFY